MDNGSLAFARLAESACGPLGWRTELIGAPPIFARYTVCPLLPEQGWKLHVSASERSAAEVLERSLRVLTADGVTFKVVTSVEHLAALNDGSHGLSQVGKFITVYPGDNEMAVRIANRLDQSLGGLRGPAVPSDRPLAGGSLVHYRYGGFSTRVMQTRMGEIVPALTTPSGEAVPDVRRNRYAPPEWVQDPFAAVGLAGNIAETAPLLRGRYLVAGVLERSARGEVYAAVDLDAARSCVVKRARHDAAVGDDGRDACKRLRHEVATLRRLAPDPRFPVVLETWMADEDAFAAMSDAGGRTLEQHVASLARYGRLPGSSEIVRLGRALVAALGAIHEHGLVHGDVKVTNVLVNSAGEVRLIDFELAGEIGAPGPARGGTYGYLSPERIAGAVPSVQDDIYAAGAVLRFTATASDPSLERGQLLGGRSLSGLNPVLSEELAEVIERCLSPVHGGRFRSMAEVDEALAVAAEARPAQRLPQVRDAQCATARYKALARQIGDRLVAAAEDADLSGLKAMLPQLRQGRLLGRDLGDGLAGAVLVLAQLVGRLGIPRYARALRAAAARLAASVAIGPETLPGLYVGEAGVAWALLSAGEVLADPYLTATALERGYLVARLPHASPDIYHGSAGRLLLHLRLWRLTGDRGQLSAALAAGDALARAAECRTGGSVLWRIPPGYGELSGVGHLGYAHGVAGIADALLELWLVSQDPQTHALVRGGVEAVRETALPALNDGAGLSWPEAPGQDPSAAFWCHGAGGIGRFLLRAAAFEISPDAENMALRAARTVAQGTRWSGPSRCHGLAGSVEFLLAVSRRTESSLWLAEAHSLAQLLEEAIVSSIDAPHEGRSGYGPVGYGLLTGYAGIASCFLHLCDPGQPPSQGDPP